MGRPYYSPSASRATIRSFRERAYALDGAVLAATGISDHEAFVLAVEGGFPESSVGASAPADAPPAFIGGEARVSAPSAGYAHVAVSFPSPASSAVASVLKHCLNLSGGGAASGFVGPGVVGAYVGADSAGVISAVDSLLSSLSSVPSSAIAERAIRLAKAEALFGLDGGSQNLADAMTKSILEAGTFGGASGVAGAYDSITAADVSAAFGAMVKNNPALAAVGDIASVPYHVTVASNFS